MILTEDKRSGKRELLGKAGDQVTIISWHGDVAIVEHKITKQRFSVRREGLKGME